MRRARGLLVQYRDEAESEAALDPALVAKELDNIKTEVLLFGATFRSLRKEGIKIELEDLAGAEFIVTEGLQPEDIPQMREIYARNYAHVPEFQQELLANFDRVTSPDQGYGYQDGGNTYYILKVAGKIRAFNRFHSIGEDREGLPFSF